MDNPLQLQQGVRDELMRWMGRVDEKLDAILRTQGEYNTRLDDVDKRIDSLERQRAWLLGAAAAIAFLMQHLPLPR